MNGQDAHSPHRQDACATALFFLRRVLERLLDVELLHLLHQAWIVRGIQDAAVLEKVENAALANEGSDLGIVAQGDDFRMLAQLERGRERKEISRVLPHRAER